MKEENILEELESEAPPLIQTVAALPEDWPFQIRQPVSEDYPFILASWSNEAHHLKYDNFIPNSIFYPRHKHLINNVLARSLIKVMHLDNYPNDIAAYLIIEPKSNQTLYIHWAHTKPMYRRMGLCKALLQDYLQEHFANLTPILVCTSPFHLLPDLIKKHGIIYDPSALDSLRAI